VSKYRYNEGLIMKNRSLRPKQVAQIKSDDVRRAGRVTRTAVGGAVGGGAVTAAMTASDMANPGTVDRVVRKAVENPEGGGSAMRDVFERVVQDAPPMDQIVDAAVNAGTTGALVFGALAGGAKLVQVGKERKAQKAAYHQANAISRAVTLNSHILKNYRSPK
jgi:hypothetical protein